MNILTYTAVVSAVSYTAGFIKGYKTHRAGEYESKKSDLYEEFLRDTKDIVEDDSPGEFFRMRARALKFQMDLNNL